MPDEPIIPSVDDLKKMALGDSGLTAVLTLAGASAPIVRALQQQGGAVLEARHQAEKLSGHGGHDDVDLAIWEAINAIEEAFNKSAEAAHKVLAYTAMINARRASARNN